MELVTAFGGLGPIPTPSQAAAGAVALVHSSRDFWRSSAFGLVLLVLLFVYLDRRILK